MWKDHVTWRVAQEWIRICLAEEGKGVDPGEAKIGQRILHVDSRVFPEMAWLGYACG